MSYKVVKYKLTSSGEIPSFIAPEGISGLYPNKISEDNSPQSKWLIGIAKPQADFKSDLLEVIETKEDLKTYLDSYTQDWTEKSTNPEPDTNEPFVITPFNQQEATNHIWNKLETLNS